MLPAAGGFQPPGPTLILLHIWPIISLLKLTFPIPQQEPGQLVSGKKPLSVETTLWSLNILLDPVWIIIYNKTQYLFSWELCRSNEIIL